MNVKHVFVCEDSVEGILSGVYQAWASKNGHDNNKLTIVGESNFELFCEYIEVEPKDELAAKVIRSIKEKISAQAYELLYKVMMTRNPMKADYVYRFLILGFHMGNQVLNYLSHDVVNQVMRLSQSVGREAHHYTGFIRFHKITDDIMMARFRPENNIVSIIAPHFSDRFPMENWIIYDESRKVAAVHEREKQWFLIHTDAFDAKKMEDKITEEENYQQIWKTFVSSISIKERENVKLQQSQIPLRYREFMNEFHN